MIFVLLCAAIYMTVRLSWRWHNTFLTPWAIYTIAWLGMFALYALGWLDFIPVSSDTWLILIGSLASYWLGAFLALGRTRYSDTKLILPDAATWFDGVNLKRYGRFQMAVTVLGLIGVVGYLLAIQRVFGLDTLFNDPGLVRSLQSEEQFVSEFFWWKFLFYLNWLAIPLGVARMVFQRRQTPRWVYVTVLIFFAVNFTLVSRSQILFVLFLCTYLVSAAFNKSLRRWEPILIGGIVAITVIYFVVAGEFLGKTYQYLISQAGDFYGPDALRPLAGFYTYVTGNIPGFQAFMREYELVHSYGLFQILPAAKILSSVGLINVELPIEVGNFLLIPFPFNTYTYLNVFYLDWGLIGVFIGPFLFGLAGNWLYRYTCLRGRVWHILLMAFITHACLSSIGTNVLISAPQWEYAFALAVLALVARKSPSDVSHTMTVQVGARRM
jgi:oligosaccharide repeat unit polymerase